METNKTQPPTDSPPDNPKQSQPHRRFKGKRLRENHAAYDQRQTKTKKRGAKKQIKSRTALSSGRLAVLILHGSQKIVPIIFQALAAFCLSVQAHDGHMSWLRTEQPSLWPRVAVSYMGRRIVFDVHFVDEAKVSPTRFAARVCLDATGGRDVRARLAQTIAKTTHGGTGCESAADTPIAPGDDTSSGVALASKNMTKRKWLETVGPWGWILVVATAYADDRGKQYYGQFCFYRSIAGTAKKTSCNDDEKMRPGYRKK